jgi:hypothetical protein
MKPAVKDIIGKTITGVVVKEGPRPNLPRTQVFLIFSDGTYYEFYSDSNITGAGGVDKGGIEEVRQYMSQHHEIIAEYSIKDVGD